MTFTVEVGILTELFSYFYFGSQKENTAEVGSILYNVLKVINKMKTFQLK